MGTWGAGSYSDDFAADLRSTITALARLPLDGDRLLDLLKHEESSANDRGGPDHMVFWLVAADQFARRGIDCDEATNRALHIIDNGLELADCQARGMSSGDLRTRGKKLTELAERLRNPPAARPRKTLKKPQTLLLEAGSVWSYPTMEGCSRNPYLATDEERRFIADGWGAMLVVACGLAFDYLAWYSVAPVHLSSSTKPTLEDVLNARFYSERWIYAKIVPSWRACVCPGTLSSVHMKRLELDFLGNLAIARNRLPNHAVSDASGYAAKNISIADTLDTKQCRKDGPPVRKWLDQ